MTLPRFFRMAARSWLVAVIAVVWPTGALQLRAAESLSATALPTDQHGRVVLDEHGQRLRHPALRPTTAASPTTSSAPVPATIDGDAAGTKRATRATPGFGPAGSPSTATNPSSQARWSYSIFGSGIGLAGLETVTIDGQTLLILGGRSDGGFGSDDFWQVLQHAPGGTNYVTAFSHPVYRSAIVRLLLADVAGDATPEIVVALADGTVEVHDARTRSLLQTHYFAADLTALAIANLDGTGRPEWVVATQNTLTVHRPDGTRWWRLNGPGGPDVAVGQCDDDASLEIVTASGHVINAATRSVQWEVADTFGYQIQLGDLDRDGRDDIVASIPWLEVRAYKVGRRQLLWSIPEVADTILLADIDGTPGLELLLGEDQWGAIRAYRGRDAASLWSLPNPSHGVTRLLVADVDADGRRELVWGTGATFTGADYLYIHDLLTREHEWRSLHLDGPFVGPGIGDIDGDGRMEIVTASRWSDSHYSNGRILVFDATNKALRAMSEPLGGSPGVPGVRDLRLRDINGDGHPEIVTAPNGTYDGVVEIHTLTSSNTFLRVWHTTNFNFGMPFDQADVADVDGDGNLEVVALNTMAHTGAAGYFLHVYDLATRALEWRATNAMPGWVYDLRMAVQDLDGDGTVEIVTLATNVGVRVFHAATKTVDPLYSGRFTALHAPGPGLGLWLGSDNGTVNHHTYSQGTLLAGSGWIAGEGPIAGISPAGSNLLWIASAGTAVIWDAQPAPVWRSQLFSVAGGSPAIATWTGPSGPEILATAGLGVLAFQPEAQANVAIVTVTAASNASEAGAQPALLRFSRSQATPDPLDVVFTLLGTAWRQFDYSVEGATRAGTGWITRIPANETNASVLIIPTQDQIIEGNETVVATVEPSEDYLIGQARTATVELGDSVTSVRVFASTAEGAEERVDGRPAPIVFTLTRVGPVQQPLAVRFNLDGTAQNGVDYRARVGAALFKANEFYAYVTIVPIDDTLGEPPESVTIEIQPGPEYTIAPGLGSASGQILDNEPTLAFGNIEFPSGKTNAAAVVSLHRSGDDLSRPVTAHYLLSRQAPGEPGTVEIEEIRFLPRQEMVTITLPAHRRQRDITEHIRIELLSHPSYIRQFDYTREFFIPAISPP